MITASISIDVPSLAEGERFYASAFGFVKASQPIAGVAVLRAGSAELCLLEKAAGTRPAPGVEETRRYERHWTPVHIDFHVDDLRSALVRALAAGAKQEQLFDKPGYPSVAFLSDPFGHGFCLIERRRARAPETLR